MKIFLILLMKFSSRRTLTFSQTGVKGIEAGLQSLSVLDRFLTYIFHFYNFICSVIWDLLCTPGKKLNLRLYIRCLTVTVSASQQNAKLCFPSFSIWLFHASSMCSGNDSSSRQVCQMSGRSYGPVDSYISSQRKIILWGAFWPVISYFCHYSRGMRVAKYVATR